MIIDTSHTPDTEEIRKFLLKFSNSLFYSEPRYLFLIQQHLDCKISWLTARTDGELKGVLPFAVKGLPMAQYITLCLIMAAMVVWFVRSRILNAN